MISTESRVKWIIDSALQISRLKAHGCVMEPDGSLVLYCKSDIDPLLKFYREKLESDAMALLVSQNVEV